MNPKPESTAVTKPKQILPADIQAKIDENRTRNAVVAAIRGTIWGKDLSQEQVRAVAQYAREVGVDPVRHVEVLGGRIYLTGELYDEKGAPLVRAGIVEPLEPEFINADDRLQKLAADGDKWAAEENARRMRERIKYNVPEKAAAAVVTRFRIPATGAVVVGVNWCGGGSRQRDPVGDAEPSKTALTRSRRRAWRQLINVVPEAAEYIRPIEARAKIVGEEIVEIHAAEPKQLPRPTGLADQDEPREPMPVVPLKPMDGDFFGEDDAA